MKSHNVRLRVQVPDGARDIELIYAWRAAALQLPVKAIAPSRNKKNTERKQLQPTRSGVVAVFSFVADGFNEGALWLSFCLSPIGSMEAMGLMKKDCGCRFVCQWSESLVLILRILSWRFSAPCTERSLKEECMGLVSWARFCWVFLEMDDTTNCKRNPPSAKSKFEYWKAQILIYILILLVHSVLL